MVERKLESRSKQLEHRRARRSLAKLVEPPTDEILVAKTWARHGTVAACSSDSLFIDKRYHSFSFITGPYFSSRPTFSRFPDYLGVRHNESQH